eukprot:5923089-Pleurochrysis_carterae.AAC.1
MPSLRRTPPWMTSAHTQTGDGRRPRRLECGRTCRNSQCYHAANGSWTYTDRSDVPSGRSLVRLIWVYKRKRSGALKARLCDAYRAAHRCTA